MHVNTAPLQQRLICESSCYLVTREMQIKQDFDVRRATWAQWVKFVASMKDFEKRSRAILLRRARQWRATCNTRRRCGCVYPAAGAAVGDWCAR
jgi:hypothetical protein